MVYLKKPSTALLQTGVLSSRTIGEAFFLLLNLVSVEPSLNGVLLVGNFFFRVGAAKSSFNTSFDVSVVLRTLFSDVSKLFIEVTDKLFESSSVFCL